ncbi:MAG: hypothetical protein ACI4B9_02225 [Eggerthellaceae bacterium]
MSPVALEQKVEKFQDMMDSTERVGVTEFARSKEWRERLPIAGCFEVVDRGGVIGYMLAPDYAEAISRRIAQLEAQTEQLQIAQMFKAREDRVDMKTGDDLKDSALAYFDEHAAELREVIDGD